MAAMAGGKSIEKRGASVNETLRQNSRRHIAKWHQRNQSVAYQRGEKAAARKIGEKRVKGQRTAARNIIGAGGEASTSKASAK